MNTPRSNAHQQDQCPICGARWDEGMTCRSIFETFLALEYEDPGYGEVHSLTVTSYMVQHHQYGEEALNWAEKALHRYLQSGTSFNLSARGITEGKRDWKVTRQPDDPPLALINWTMTIADVYRQYHDAHSYRDLILQWARTVLEEMQPLVSR
jgi:hypothetical protein